MADVSLKDWDVKEQESLKQVEEILERTDEILEVSCSADRAPSSVRIQKLKNLFWYREKKMFWPRRRCWMLC